MANLDNSGLNFQLGPEASAPIRKLAERSGKDINEIIRTALGLIVIGGNLPKGQKISIVRDDAETIKDLIKMEPPIEDDEMAEIKRLIEGAHSPSSPQKATTNLGLPKGHSLPGISDGQMPSQ